MGFHCIMIINGRPQSDSFLTRPILRQRYVNCVGNSRNKATLINYMRYIRTGMFREILMLANEKQYISLCTYFLVLILVASVAQSCEKKTIFLYKINSFTFSLIFSGIVILISYVIIKCYQMQLTKCCAIVQYPPIRLPVDSRWLPSRRKERVSTLAAFWAPHSVYSHFLL